MVLAPPVDHRHRDVGVAGSAVERRHELVDRAGVEVGQVAGHDDDHGVGRRRAERGRGGRRRALRPGRSSSVHHEAEAAEPRRVAADHEDLVGARPPRSASATAATIGRPPTSTRALSSHPRRRGRRPGRRR